MYVTEVLLYWLTVVGSFALSFYLPLSLMRVVADAVGRSINKTLRLVGIDRYIPLIALPTSAAIAGGVFGAAASILAADPSLSRPGELYKVIVLILLGGLLAVFFPLKFLVSLHKRPHRLEFERRIAVLKSGDFSQDDQTDIVSSIDREHAAIISRINRRRNAFIVLIVFLLVIDVATFILFRSEGHGLSAAQLALVIVSIPSSLVGRFVVRRQRLRRFAADLDALRNAARRLKMPTPSSSGGAHSVVLTVYAESRLRFPMARRLAIPASLLVIESIRRLFK